MLSQQITHKYQTKALETLARLKKSSSPEVGPPPSYDRYIFEAYSDQSMEDKIKHDTSYYNVLFKNIEESETELAHMLLGDLFSTTRAIYEHINIRPKLFGAKAIALNENDDIIEETATRMIDEYIDSNYYSLSQESRDDKYRDKVIAESESLVVESAVDPEEAIDFCYKVAVMESLIGKISFPSVIEYKIDEILSSDVDKQIFEQGELSDLWGNFQTQANRLAKLISTTV